MGKNKALLPVPGKAPLTLVEHLTLLLSVLCEEVLLVVRDGPSSEQYLPLPFLRSCRLVYDQVPDQGPLMGLYSGLRQATGSHALVLAVDMPFVKPSLIAWLHAFPLTDEILVPYVHETPQVLLARYPCSVIPVIESCLEDGQRSLRALLETAPVRFLAESEVRAVDPELSSFVNVNTPGEFERVYHA